MSSCQIPDFIHCYFGKLANRICVIISFFIFLNTCARFILCSRKKNCHWPFCKLKSNKILIKKRIIQKLLRNAVTKGLSAKDKDYENKTETRFAKWWKWFQNRSRKTRADVFSQDETLNHSSVPIIAIYFIHFYPFLVTSCCGVPMKPVPVLAYAFLCLDVNKTEESQPVMLTWT